METGNELPTYATRDRKITSRARNKKLPPLSYPLATGPSQRTGDRLVIKCLKFEPPEAGAGATITPTNLFKEELDAKGKPTGNRTVFTTAEREEARANIAAGKKSGYGSYTGEEKIGLEYSVTDANTRMSKDANRSVSYTHLTLPTIVDV